VNYSNEEVLSAMRLVAKAVGAKGIGMNQSLVEGASEIHIATGGKKGDLLPMASCVAVAMSWLTLDASSQTHAGKIHDLIQACATAHETDVGPLIDAYSHPKKFAVHFGVRFWIPHIRAHGLDWVASPKECREIHDRQIVARGHTQNCRWSVLAPIKVATLTNRWKRKAINRITPPLGSTVRTGLQNLLGYAVPTPENAAGHQVAYGLQHRLAELASVSVQDVNSGLWQLGA